jgi:hypothetical protein
MRITHFTSLGSGSALSRSFISFFISSSVNLTHRQSQNSLKAVMPYWIQHWLGVDANVSRCISRDNWLRIKSSLSLSLSLSTCGCLEWRISGWSHAYPCFVVGISSSTWSRAASAGADSSGPDGSRLSTNRRYK